MIVFLNILKIIGIILLCILGLLLLLLILILFVPIRYRLKADRKLKADTPVRAEAKITWLMHLISAAYQYPKAPYLKVRILGIPVYSTEIKENKRTKDEEQNNKNDNKEEYIRILCRKKIYAEESKANNRFVQQKFCKRSG